MSDGKADTIYNAVIQCFNDRIRIYTEEIQRLADDNEKLTHSLRVSKMDNKANTQIAKERENYLIECNKKMKLKLAFYEQKSERLLTLNMDLAKRLNIEKMSNTVQSSTKMWKTSVD